MHGKGQKRRLPDRYRLPLWYCWPAPRSRPRAWWGLTLDLCSVLVSPRDKAFCHALSQQPLEITFVMQPGGKEQSQQPPLPAHLYPPANKSRAFLAASQSCLPFLSPPSCFLSTVCLFHVVFSSLAVVLSSQLGVAWFFVANSEVTGIHWIWRQQPHWLRGRQSGKGDEALQLPVQAGLAASATHSGSPTELSTPAVAALPCLALPCYPFLLHSLAVLFILQIQVMLAAVGDVSAFSRRTPKAQSRGASRSACNSWREDAVAFSHCTAAA